MTSPPESLLCSCSFWLFVTPRTGVHQAPLSMDFSKQGYWNGLPFPTSGDLPSPEMEPTSLASAALAGEFFTIVPPQKLQKSLLGSASGWHWRGSGGGGVSSGLTLFSPAGVTVVGPSPVFSCVPGPMTWPSWQTSLQWRLGPALKTMLLWAL